MQELKNDFAMRLQDLNDEVNQKINYITAAFTTAWDNHVQDLLGRIQRFSELHILTKKRREEVRDKWDEISCRKELRDTLVAKMEVELVQEEQRRARASHDIMIKFGKDLERVNYPNPKSAIRFIQEETAAVDLALLSNKDSIIRFVSQFKRDSIDLEKKMKNIFDEVVEKWRMRRFEYLFGECR